MSIIVTLYRSINRSISVSDLIGITPESIRLECPLFEKASAFIWARKGKKDVSATPECVDDVLLDLGVAAEHHLDELVEVDGAVAVLVDVPARARSHSHSECTNTHCHRPSLPESSLADLAAGKEGQNQRMNRGERNKST